MTEDVLNQLLSFQDAVALRPYLVGEKVAIITSNNNKPLLAERMLRKVVGWFKVPDRLREVGSKHKNV